MKIERDSPVPVYLQIKMQIERLMAERALKPGDPLPTLTEIAQEAGVSLRTAQMGVDALRRGGLARRIGRRLVVGDGPAGDGSARDVFVVCLGAGSNGFDLVSGRILNGLREEAARQSDGAEVVFAGDDAASSFAYYRRNPGMRVRGAILVHWQEFDRLAALAGEHPDLPFVHTNHFLEGVERLPENVRGVYNDDYAGAYQAAEHLAGQGCRRPVFLELAIRDQVYHERRRGFMAALADRGLAGQAFVQENRLDVAPGERMLMYRQFCASVLRREPDLDGVCACNDSIAVAADQTLREEGRACPVVGYDDYSECTDVKISTVAVDYERIGREAVRQLVADGRPRFHKLMPRLTLRRHEPRATVFPLNILRVVNT